MEETPDTKPTTDDELVALGQAMGHPVRIYVLGAVSKRPASPSQIARDMSRDTGQKVKTDTVAYHVHKLETLGFVEWVTNREIPTGIERLYRATRRPQVTAEMFAAMPTHLRDAWMLQQVQIAFRETADAINVGAIQHQDPHFWNLPLTLDEEGWRQADEILKRTIEQLYRAQDESVQRLATDRSGGEERPAQVNVQAFERPTPALADKAASTRANPQEAP